MKGIVIYDTSSGKTQKIAETTAETLRESGIESGAIQHRQSGGFKMLKNARRLQKPLLICGLLTLVVFALTDSLAGTLWNGYNFAFQSISELSAIDAPTRSLVVPLNLIYYALAIAFGLGVGLYGRKRVLHVIAGLLVGNAVIGVAVIVFFPMQFGEAVSATHLILMATSAVFLQMLIIIFGSFAFHNWFRFYSIGTLLTFLVLTIFGLFIVPQINVGPPQSGIQERVLAYGCLLWQAMLSISLLRAKEQGLG